MVLRIQLGQYQCQFPNSQVLPVRGTIRGVAETQLDTRQSRGIALRRQHQHIRSRINYLVSMNCIFNFLFVAQRRTVLNTHHIGSNTAIMSGRLRLVCSRFQILSSAWLSYFVHHRVSPVSICFAFRRLLSRTGAYVSFTKQRHAVDAPPHISTIQLIQRHPRYW